MHAMTTQQRQDGQMLQNATTAAKSEGGGGGGGYGRLASRITPHSNCHIRQKWWFHKRGGATANRRNTNLDRREERQPTLLNGGPMFHTLAHH